MLALALLTILGLQDGFVTVADGDFVLDGCIWHPYGTFYRPPFVLGGPDDEQSCWVTEYEHDAIVADLDRMAALGFNAIRMKSPTLYQRRYRDENWAQMPTPETSYKARLHAILDELGKRDMKLQLFINYEPRNVAWMPGVFPFVCERTIREEALEIIRKTIVELDLAERPEIWSFEIDWEPHVGDADARNTDSALITWNQWVRDQYGTLAAAETAWGYTGGAFIWNGTRYLLAPSDEEVLSDGPWTNKTLAYRRFITHLINKRYAYLRHAIRDVDARHLVTAQRVAFVNLIPNHDNRILYPMRHTECYLDYFGYTFAPADTWSWYDETAYLDDPNGMRKQAFVVRYADYHKPVIFTEYGRTTYHPNHVDVPVGKLERLQAIHYDQTLSMAHEFGIDGVLAWWWQGRRPYFKDDPEQSDWGILRPNGTPKPCAEVLKKHAQPMKSIPPFKGNETLVVDEFAHACEGEMMREGKEAFLAALQRGGRPDVVTTYENSDSWTCPLTRLHGAETGPGPLRALDASLGIVEVQGPQGTWQDIQYGEAINVDSETARLRVSAANSGDANWRHQGVRDTDTGKVVLEVRTGETVFQAPISADVPADGTTIVEMTVPRGTVELQMAAVGRARFGEVLRFTTQ